MATENRTLSIFAKLVDQFSGPMSKVGQTITKFAGSAVNQFGSMVKGIFSLRTAFAAMATALGGGFLAGQVKAIADQTDEMAKLAESTGDSVESLSELRAAFELANVKGAEFEQTLRVLTKAQGDALAGNQDMRAAFAQLGLSLQDLGGAPSEVFEKIARGLERFQTAGGKARALAEILPKQFLAILPAVGTGLADFQQSILEVRGLHATITTEQAKAADALGDAFTKMKIAVEGIARDLVVAFGPGVTATLERLAHTISDNRQSIVGFAKDFGRFVVQQINNATDALIGFVEAIDSIPGVDLQLGLRKEVDAIQETLRQIREGDSLLMGSVDPKKLEQRLADLKQQLARGLGPVLRESQRVMRESLAAAADQIAESAAPKTPEQTATILGLPTATDWVKWSEDLVERAKATRRVLDTVFPEDRKRGSGIGAIEEIAPKIDPAQAVQQRLQLMQSLASMNSELEPFKRQLIEIDAAAQSLSFKEAAAKGVIGLAEMNAALELIAQHARKLQEELNKKDFFGGFSKGVEDAIRAWTDFRAAGVEASQTLINNGLNGFVDALAAIQTRTASAGEAFRAFAKSVISDVAHIIDKLVVMRLLMAFGLNIGGGAAAGGGPNPVTGGATSPGGLSLGGTGTGTGVLGLRLDRGGGGGLGGVGGSSFVSRGRGNEGGGSPIVINITAMDSKDVARALVENRGTLRQILTNQLGRHQDVRHAVQATR